MTWVAFKINGQFTPNEKHEGLPDYYPLLCHEFDSEERAREMGDEYTVMTAEAYEGYRFGCETAVKHERNQKAQVRWYQFWR